MAQPRIEHVNITVSNPGRAADLMRRLFGWRIRWEGPARDNGRTIHVGTDDSYIALYAPPGAGPDYGFSQGQPLNHIGVEVEDLAAVEALVLAEGFEPRFQGVYQPGPAHFYFTDHDDIEYEVVSYAGRA
ncbi:VOC family protein [Sphingomonas sabuli]|uniref:VOC family protein n=1 Tax=Sphingomonas sabuli TaxID=2764186 RepID=A0A7G9L0Y8_9SPHN|nr:VOC family protein [Sphingomonas sabuli]QNM82287.1 VOC family protein [Sphingomonas sabuli]